MSDNSCNTNTQIQESSLFICPVTGHEANGKHSFSVISVCGHVLSDKAIKEVPSKFCYQCQKEFSPEDILSLNPTGDKLNKMKAEMELKLADRKGKKSKKRERSKLDKSSFLSIKVKEVIKDANANLEKFKHDKVCKSLFSEKKLKTQ